MADKLADQPTSRRAILAYLGLGIAGLSLFFLTLGRRLLDYFSGPKLSELELNLIAKQEAQEKKKAEYYAQLKEVRVHNDKVAVARLSELEASNGKLVQDYFMQPALVALTANKQCIARSAVCTHLGCTVQEQVTDGKIVCPCHASIFDLVTGKVISGPAQYPLAQEPLLIEGDQVYLVRPKQAIKIGPTQKEYLS